MAAGARKTRAGAGPWRILQVALVSQIGISVVDQGIPSLTGFIKADLGLSAAAAGLAVSAFTFGRIFGAYAAGEAADRVGERRVLIFGSLAILPKRDAKGKLLTADVVHLATGAVVAELTAPAGAEHLVPTILPDGSGAVALVGPPNKIVRFDFAAPKAPAP